MKSKPMSVNPKSKKNITKEEYLKIIKETRKIYKLITKILADIDEIPDKYFLNILLEAEKLFKELIEEMEAKANESMS